MKADLRGLEAHSAPKVCALAQVGPTEDADLNRWTISERPVQARVRRWSRDWCHQKRWFAPVPSLL